MPDQQHREQTAHLSRLRQLARELAVPEEFAVAIYESELVRLLDGAHVERFVGIFAEKRARLVLKGGRQGPFVAAAERPRQPARPDAMPKVTGTGHDAERADPRPASNADEALEVV